MQENSPTRSCLDHRLLKLNALVSGGDYDLINLALQVGHDIDKGGMARFGAERASLHEQSFCVE